MKPPAYCIVLLLALSTISCCLCARYVCHTSRGHGKCGNVQTYATNFWRTQWEFQSMGGIYMGQFSIDNTRKRVYGTRNAINITDESTAVSFHGVTSNNLTVFILFFLCPRFLSLVMSLQV